MNRIALLSLCLPVLTGCVALQDYQSLEAVNRQQAEQIAQADEDVVHLRAELEQARREIGARDQRIVALEDGRNIGAALAPVVTPVRPQPAAFKSEPEPAPWDWGGLEGNPKTQGAMLPADLAFAPGSDQLSSAGKKALDKLAGKLRATLRQGRKLRIEGHTDRTPIKRSKKRFADNQALGLARAKRVHDYLVQGGVNPRYLKTRSLADTHPIDQGTTPRALARNRRVELVME